jgi:hypothetical protein
METDSISRSASAITSLCREIHALCDVLRGTRAYMLLCTAFPSEEPTEPRRLMEARLREQNCLYLLRERRAQLIREMGGMAT